MPFHIIKSDITLLNTDAIVNAANNTLLGGGGVDGAIHSAAGPQLLEECKTLNGCETGKAKITGGYNLPAKYIIHTVGPVYSRKDSRAEELLRSCYRSCLEIAREKSLESIAFPLISAGAYGYPADEAMRVAKEEITGFLRDNDMDVTLCLYGRTELSSDMQRGNDIDRYITLHLNEGNSGIYGSSVSSFHGYASKAGPDYAPVSAKKERKHRLPLPSKSKPAYSEPIGSYEECSPEISEVCSVFRPELDESFSEMLMRKIDEKGMKDSECYFKANVDRRLFSKIRSNKDYKPSKETAVAFAIALELNKDETDEMLRKAGYALSDSFMFDVIVKYYIENGKYDIFEINETLFRYDQKTI